MRGRRGAAGALGIAAGIALLLAGCASLTADGGTTSPGGADDGGSGPADLPADGSGDVLVQVTTSIGYGHVGEHFRTLPSLTVYSDGLAVTPGPTTLEYPGRLLPHLVTHRLDADGLAAVREAAADADLLGPAPDYGTPEVADAGTTTVPLTVDGDTWEHRAYALEPSASDGATGGRGPDAARAALAGFVDTVHAEVAAAPETGSFEPDRYAVMVLEAADAEPSGDLPVGEHGWPLAELGEVDCRVVEGDDADALGAVLRDARQGDRFTHDGVAYEVWVRVLLPGEAGCAEGEGARRR